MTGIAVAVPSVEDVAKAASEASPHALSRVLGVLTSELDPRHDARQAAVLGRSGQWWVFHAPDELGPPDLRREVAFTAIVPAQDAGPDRVGEVDVVALRPELVHDAYRGHAALIPVEVAGCAEHPVLAVRGLRPAPATPLGSRLLLAALAGAGAAFWTEVTARCHQGPRGWSATTLAQDPWVASHLATADRLVDDLRRQAGDEPAPLGERVHEAGRAVSRLHDEALRLVGARANYLTNEIGMASRYLLGVQDLISVVTRPQRTPAGTSPTERNDR